MQLKAQRQLLNCTSKRVLRQLEENESLRIELFRLRSDMRDQHHHFLSSTLNHEMLLEKIITALSLACRTAKQPKNRPQNNEVLYSAIEHSLCDLQGMLESYGRSRGEWSKSKPDASELYYQKLLKECSERFDSAQAGMQQLKNERECLLEERRLKMTQIQFLQGELGRLKQKYDLSAQQSNSLRAENSKLSQAFADLQLKLNSCGEQVAKLKSNNDALSNSLKQSRQVANRHTEYLSNKCEGIQRENKRLIDMLKENQLKEQQMTATAAASQQEIEKLKEETQRLKAQVQTFQVKFKEIIDKQNRIRQLQTIKQKKIEAREPLGQIGSRNSSDQCQNRALRKEAGKMINKKFNLQSFQEKLSAGQEKLSTGQSTISLHDPCLPV